MPPSNLPAIDHRRSRRPAAPAQVPLWRPRPAVHRHLVPVPPAGAHGPEELLDGLNPEQRRAVVHGSGPLLVVAGAGTGKTQVITRRIAWLIASRNARPSEILGLTFTDKAAAEMQARVDELVPYGYADATLATFHAFGDRVIREFAFELGLPPDARVLSAPEVVIFLRERLFEFELDAYRPLGDPTRFLAALAGHFSRCKDEDISPAAYLACADRLVGDAERLAALASGSIGGSPEREQAASAAEAASRQLELARAYARYQALLGAAGLIDFGDQVSLALRLLRESATARELLQRRFRYILVDEFQDTNRAQAELVALLAERHRNVTVVGDDDQSIYRFRGAAVSNILEFRQRYRRSRLVVLRRNYRSRAGILAASHRLVRYNDPDRLEVRARISKELKAARPDPAIRVPAVRHESFPTAANEADWIAAQIAARVTAGATLRDHAVLVRTNAGAEVVLRALNMAGLPWRFSGASGLYGRPEVRLLLGFLRCIADLGSTIDLYGLAASEVYGLHGPDLTAIMTMARRRNRTLWDVLEELDRQPGLLRLDPATRAAARRLVLDMRAYSELAHARPCGEVLYAFLKASGILGRLAADEAGEEPLQNIARFFEIVRGQSALLPDDRTVFVARHLQTLIDAGDEPPTAEVDPEADVVSVLTVHKAKGLEFPVVYMAGLVDGRFPAVARRDGLQIPDELLHETIPSGDHHIQEERRLFYVGMTRARDELVLTHAADYGGRRSRRVSPFVQEALDLPIAGPVSPAREKADLLGQLAAGVDSVARTTPPRPPRSTEPLSLSFYQVDDYLTCPQKYKFNHVLRVPVSPHHSIIYGAALHRAVQEFHKRHARGEVMSEADLTASFEAAWSSEGFLNRDHELARLEAGRTALRRFRLEQLQPNAVIPAYVERDFTFSLDGDRIRGRWDRVDVEPGPALPVDARPPASTDDGANPDEGGELVPFEPDVVEPTLALLPREVVTITDYKSTDVRDPDKARQRARDSLQLTIYAMGWQAMTGRLPDAVQLNFLETGLVGRAEVDDKRLAKGRGQIEQAATGIRARDFTPRPDLVACSYCPFRDICPASLAR